MIATKSLGMLVLAIFLIVSGIAGLGVKLGALSIVIPILALIAGIFILIGK